MASILERQIQISEDLLVEQLTSEIEHLDLLRAKQNIRAQIRDAQQAIQELDSGIRQFELEMSVQNNYSKKKSATNYSYKLKRSKSIHHDWKGLQTRLTEGL